MSSTNLAPAQRGGRRLWDEVKKVEEENVELWKEVVGRRRVSLPELNQKFARYQQRLQALKDEIEALKKASKNAPPTTDAQTQTTARPTSNAQTQTTAPTTSNAQTQTIAGTTVDAQTQTTAGATADAQTQTTTPTIADAQTQTDPDASQAASEAQNTAQQIKIQELEFSLHQLQFENAALSDTQETSDALKAAHAKDIKDLQDVITDLQGQVATAVTQNAALDAKKAEIKRLQKKLDALQKDRAENEKENKKNADKIAENAKKIDELHKQSQDLQGKLDTATTQSADSGDRAAEIKRLQAKLASITKERDDAVRERDGADAGETQSSKLKRLADEKEQLQGSLAKKQKKLDDAKAAAARPSDKEKKCEEEKKRLKGELTKSEQKVAGLIKKLKDVVDAAAKQSDKEKKCQEEKKHLQEELDKLRKKVAELTKKLKDAANAAADPSGNEKKCQEEKKRLQEELDRLRKKIAELTKKLADADYEKNEAIRTLKADLEDAARRAQHKPDVIDLTDTPDVVDLTSDRSAVVDLIPTLKELYPSKVAILYTDLLRRTRVLVEEILGTREDAIAKNLKGNPNIGFTFREFLAHNPDLVDRNYGVDHGILISSVLIRYLHNWLFVSTKDLYPELAPFIDGLKKVRDSLKKDGKSDTYIKLWTGYWYQSLFSSADFDQTRDKVADQAAEALFQLVEFAAIVSGRDDFLTRVKNEVVVPALRLNEQFEASASYWYLGLKSPQEVWAELSGADGDALLHALGRYQFTNISDNLRQFQYPHMARRLQLPEVPENKYVCPNFHVLANVAPNLTVRVPSPDGASFEEPEVLVNQSLLISWVPPGATRTAAEVETIELARLLLLSQGEAHQEKLVV